MEWISVDDILPDDLEPVLVLTEMHNHIHAYREGQKQFSKKPRWFDFVHEEEIENVTHWMNLPNAPRE